MSSELPLRTPQELTIMREAGRIAAQVLARMKELAAPGATTIELDRVAEETIRAAGARPAFKGYRGPGKEPFPASICASVNDQVVHGIPSKRPLEPGDILSVDVGVEHMGFYGDTAATFPIGKIDARAEKLIQVCAESLGLAIREVKPGNALSKIGEVIQRHVEKNGFSVVRDFVGHGIGRQMHQPPEVPNFATRRVAEIILRPGLVIAIEPMINAGGWQVRSGDRDWPVRTADGKLSAHFEHTVAVTVDGCEILTLP